MELANHDVASLQFKVFRPNATAAVITAPFETVYSKMAKLLWEEHGQPKSKAKPAIDRGTRQRTRIAAAWEKRLQADGLSNIQMQQMREVVAELMQPVMDEQQQQKQHITEMRDRHSDVMAQLKESNTNSQQLNSTLAQFVKSIPLPQPQQMIGLPAHVYGFGGQFAPALPQYAASVPHFAPAMSEYATAASKEAPPGAASSSVAPGT